MSSHFFPMNTKTKVPTESPESNEFGHTEAFFLYLVNAQTGTAPKVVADYGPAEVGSVHWCTQDTGLGHRSMADHRVVAVKNGKTGEVTGTLPKGKTLPFWVMK